MQGYTIQNPKGTYPSPPKKFTFGTSPIVLLKRRGQYEIGDELVMHNMCRYPGEGYYLGDAATPERAIKNTSKFRAGIEFDWI